MRIHGTTVTAAMTLAAICGSMISNGAAIAQATPAAAPSVRYEGKDERRDRLDAMQGKPFDATLWTGLSTWRNGAVTAESTKDKVVVLVTWSSWYRTSHEALKGAQALADKFGKDGLVVVGVHDQQGYDKAAEVLGNQGAKFSVALDKGNALRKALDVDNDPDFYVIDRAGNLRYADIATNSVESAVTALIAETPEQAKGAKAPSSKDGRAEKTPDPMAEKPAAESKAANMLGATATGAGVTFALPDEATYTAAKWPTHNKGRLAASNLQGKKLPTILGSETFLDGKPDVAGKVIIIDFWATWCGPCRASMPGLDKVSKQFADDAVVIGISDEGEDVVRKFLSKNKHSYVQAIDEKATISNSLSIQGIPHAIILSTDGVIRWQGHPGEVGKLASTIGAVIKADPGVKARRDAEAAAPKK